MIQLGLRRAAQLFRNNPQPWRAVHVAGTNGKGTVCAYLSALLHSSGISCGRFTSPHLIDQWDCITINEKPVSEALFREVEADVLRRNRDEDINATEFEVLTATAFDIFTQANVEVGVVEVGMGGRDDATNVLRSKAVAVITRIGLDHQAFLGDTLADIARHKCGIFAPDVPVIYNAANEPSVVSVIKHEAEQVGARPLWPVADHAGLLDLPGSAWQQFTKHLQARESQRIAIAQAWRAYTYLLHQLRPEERGLKRTVEAQRRARDAILNVRWPGRMQRVSVAPLVPRGGTILLDGAHNAQAAQALAATVDHELRKGGKHRISWLLASTQGRDVKEFLSIVLRPGDRIACVEFGPVDGMPWVKAQPPATIARAARELHPEMEVACFGTDITAGLEWAGDASTRGAASNHVVATGSLYLASDLLRLLRAAGGDIYGNDVAFHPSQDTT